MIYVAQYLSYTRSKYKELKLYFLENSILLVTLEDKLLSYTKDSMFFILKSLDLCVYIIFISSIAHNEADKHLIFPKFPITFT